MKFIDIDKFERLNRSLSTYVYDLAKSEDFKHMLVPLYISIKFLNGRIVDLTIYKNHYVLLKKLHTHVGNDQKSFVCRKCWSS